jgi:hypothetical protein
MILLLPAAQYRAGPGPFRVRVMLLWPIIHDFIEVFRVDRSFKLDSDRDVARTIQRKLIVFGASRAAAGRHRDRDGHGVSSLSQRKLSSYP